ncbi:transposase [Vibrio vulnificus]|uniref:transposase n=1 Tax=Vibrio vulnificus TaxID=672 RepID=UPI0023B02926|nr:transposase [Vibrio vulnificus]
MTDNTVVSLNTPQDPLTELIRQGARDLIAQAVEAELQQLLAQHQSVMVDGKQAIVRNGFLPERTLQTGVGDVEVQIPKVRDRSGNGVKFNSSLITTVSQANEECRNTASVTLPQGDIYGRYAARS